MSNVQNDNILALVLWWDTNKDSSFNSTERKEDIEVNSLMESQMPKNLLFEVRKGQ